MKDEKKAIRDYAQGLHDGRSGKSYPIPSVMDIVLGVLVPAFDPAGQSEDYDQGYRDGKEDSKRSK